MHYRDTTGRYVVPLPIKECENELGNSYALAQSRLYSLEKKFDKDPELKKAYTEFMTEYRDLGHMTLVNPNSAQKGKYYIPHFGVWKLNINDKKLRTVFDASMKTTNGRSLNDILMAGPKLQLDITEVLTNFRFNKIAFVADICKMYRQVLIRPEHRSFQHVLWRDDRASPIQEFQLNTVTYGESPSPYLALQTINQLANDEGERYPKAAKVLKTSVYVDDILTGAPTVTAAKQLKTELIDILRTGKFELKKWASNHPEILAGVPSQDTQISLDFTESDKPILLLGLQWNPRNDHFSYKYEKTELVFTKRAILSLIAKIYDPMGWICPIVFIAKHIIRKLWEEGIDWDDPVPIAIKNQWITFMQSMSDIRNISIPRYVLQLGADNNIDIIGFSDASELGYGASVYIRTEPPSGPPLIHLLLAKSKVSPIKTISIPRLELCGAVLLTKLITFAVNVCNASQPIRHTFAFTDSTIVLAWLKIQPYRLKTFVANRVTQITETNVHINWHHVRSEDNPADLASRGTLPSQIVRHDQWWHGPTFLTLPVAEWPTHNSSTTDSIPDLKQNCESTIFTLHSVTDESWTNLLESNSKLRRVERVTAWILRFIHNCRSKDGPRKLGPLSPQEMSATHTFWIKYVQNKHFAPILKNVSDGDKSNLNLKSLSPFLDKDNILRVGGRLRNAKISDDSKYPIILPKTDHFTRLLIDHHHNETLHGGPRITLASINLKYWILGGRDLVRRRLKECIPCFKARPTNSTPPMGDLPAYRVRQARPFSKVGLDFGGPFSVRENKLRNSRITKAYLALFICMTTKAVHLDLVSELTSDAFIAALDRFFSRRGLCTDIFSDNGTNFVGANHNLQEVLDFLQTHDSKEAITNYLTNKNINWHFIPPSAPHFGGLWEAGIKSTKYHLKRVMGTQIFTFEELTTLLTKIEAILNSRPLCPISTDPSDIGALTPGHFLIGDNLASLPEHNLENIPTNRLDRWALVKSASQAFWRSWHHDYLNTLQQRHKWTKDTQNIQADTLVLIKDDNLPPLHWPMGRVTQCFPGTDGITRAAEIKTPKGLIRRPVVKLFPLPSI